MAGWREPFPGESRLHSPSITDVQVISTAMADLLVEVLGPARGIGARATIGVQSPAGNHHCYESWIEIEIR